MQATIKADKLAALLAGASVAACTDKSVSVLNKVQLEIDNGVIRLSATDRYRLAIGELPIEYTGDPIKVFITNDNVKPLLSWLKSMKDNLIVIFQFDNGFKHNKGLILNCGGNEYKIITTDTDYPDLNKIIPTEFDGVSEIYFDSTYLSDVVKVSGKGVRIKWQLSTPVRPALATFSDKHGIEWQYVVMPQRVK